MSYAFTPVPQPTLPIKGSDKLFPIHRVYCVGRNYDEHTKEMGGDTKDPPFFFQKNPDCIVSGGTFAYPAQTSNVHFEIELVVALKSGGINIARDQALGHVFSYAVGIDMTRRDLQIASRKKEQPWEIGKSFDFSAPCGALRPAAEIGHPVKGKIWLSVNGTEKQKGDLSEMIWNVPEIIGKLSLQVSLGAGDIILTGTPAGVGPVQPGDKIECGIDGIGTLKVSIG